MNTRKVNTPDEQRNSTASGQIAWRYDMKTLVTGATGFIGSVLVRELVERGHAVRALSMVGESTELLEKLGVEI